MFCAMRRNSVLDGLRSNLFKFIQERMSVKVVVSVSRHRAEFVEVKEMYSMFPPPSDPLAVFV